MEQENMNKKKASKPFKVIFVTLAVAIPLMTTIYAFSYLFPIPLEKIGEPPVKIARHIENVYTDGKHLWITGFLDDTRTVYKEEFSGELICVRKNKYRQILAIFSKNQIGILSKHLFLRN